MKKGMTILLLTFGLCLCLVVGIFIGRNLRDDYRQLPMSNIPDASSVQIQTNDYRLDINTASKALLMDLPGIGETMAQRILDYREELGPFQSTDELMLIEGIGEKTLLQIEGLIKVGGQ